MILHHLCLENPYLKSSYYFNEKDINNKNRYIKYMSLVKNEKIKEKPIHKIEKSHTLSFCKKKVEIFMQMITNTIISAQRYKSMDIITASDMNICIQNLEMLYAQLKSIDAILKKKQENNNFDDIITALQKINNELSALFRTTGTHNICDIIMVAMGNDFLRDLLSADSEGIFEVIKTYTHPISYIVLPWRGDDQKKTDKKIAKNRIVEDFTIVETSNNFDCFDLARTSKEFHKKVYGIKVAIHNELEKKTLIISGIVDDILIDCTNHVFIKEKMVSLTNNKPNEPDFLSSEFERFCDVLTIKELLIYRKEELYQRFSGYINQTHLIKQKPISQNVKEFIGSGLYGQRRTLIQLLLKQNDPEFQYLAYLLYDLLSNDSNGSIDTVEQTILFDSLPWNIKKYFRDAMKTTVNYTKTLTNFDNNKIPIEQQICLLKASDNIKEKAMIKLKEDKAKSEDSGSKARQYLEGLLKIPFGIFRKESILGTMDEIKEHFRVVVTEMREKNIDAELPQGDKYSSLEVARYFPNIAKGAVQKFHMNEINRFRSLLCKGKRDTLIANTCFINGIIKKHGVDTNRLCHSGKKNGFMRDNIKKFIDNHKDNQQVIRAIKDRYSKIFDKNSIDMVTKHINCIRSKRQEINNTLLSIDSHLDAAVHGHKNAKRQLKRIIGQWINGAQNGYCFGFEGPPGVGKTSLAKKGLAKCLTDKENGCRPFAFIPIGGSSNGSTLSGHNYTYVGSTWGRIVDILMETKCMNPIIFIDELDKVSRSENGKEIIGILTHLVDESQNESYQDKYFSGVDLDLSKALFIFSYNDPDMIDRILLDRIHRVKFDNLTLEDKITITRNYILPEIYTKVGLTDCIVFSEDVIIFLIETYTYEPGVRKLKEILFEIISEINLEILTADSYNDLPIVITKKDISMKYLKNRIEITFTKIHKKPTCGVVTGLWANSLGKGGIIPIESVYYPATNLLEFKLTGLQGDVMKESGNVAKSLAWKLTSSKRRKALLKQFENTKMQGVQLHCPEGATPKDGPSAGTAMTVAMYSLFNNKKVKNDIAITGEINLQGAVTAIGGLKLKILGGIKAGVKLFIFPKSNQKDFDKFLEKYKNKPIIKGIKFHPVEHISEVLKLVFV